MSKLTNNSNLPEALVRAMTNDPYDKGDSDFTATSLLKPARVVALEKRHAHEMSEDAEDGLYRLYGQVAHGILERANMADLAEKRFYSNFEVNGKNYKVSAQMDTLSIVESTLSDFKFTTAWGFKKDQAPKADWVAQLNIQLELMRYNGLDAKKLQIIGLLRDFQLSQAKNDPNYPQSPVATHAIPMWSRETTMAFIKMRIAAHVDAKTTLPECTKEETWAKPDTWAVIKNGGKRAINGGVCLSLEGAEAVKTNNPGTFIQVRPGESVRCASYCSAAPFCTQFAREQNKEPEGAKETA